MVYHGHLSSEKDLIDQFCLSQEQLKGFKILYAIYETESYEGSAFVLLKKEGKFYEVNASHCSCNGLEDQWRPEETTIKALLARPNIVKEVKELLRLCVMAN